MTTEQRARALLYLSRFVGTDVTAAFLKKSDEHCSPAGVPHIHSLQEGIYKPAGSSYAFSVWSRSALEAVPAVYPDRLVIETSGTWTLEYSPREGALDLSSNRALLACMRDRLPVLALATSRPKTAPGGGRYRILGLVMVDGYDAAANLFLMRGCTTEVLNGLSDVAEPMELESVLIRDDLLLPFRLAEPRRRYVTSRDARDRAFRAIVLDEYKRQCCVCGSLFHLRDGDANLIEAQAAHIIPVPRNGPDDPRNALSLCRRHHWAFDQGLFTVTDGLLVRVSRAVARAEQRRFDLEEYDGTSISRPTREACVPDPLALGWHHTRIFRAA